MVQKIYDWSKVLNTYFLKRNIFQIKGVKSLLSPWSKKNCDWSNFNIFDKSFLGDTFEIKGGCKVC